jgi:hypothetical protein
VSVSTDAQGDSFLLIIGGVFGGGVVVAGIVLFVIWCYRR